ncbi:MAG: hypothetical protein U0903_05580 [Planctomycetales bacterium]
MLLTGLAVMSSAAEPLRNRREFVAALNKIEEEMPEAEVLKLLGKPDDIQTHEDHGGSLGGRGKSGVTARPGISPRRRLAK